MRFRGEYRRVIQALVSGRQALGSGTDVAEIEIELKRADGSVFDAFLRIAAVRDGQGKFLYTRATVIDITARKLAEAELREHSEELQAISERVVEIQDGRIAAGVSA